MATAAIYVPCWTYPWLRTLFEYGTGQRAQMVVEENGFLRINIVANFTWRPGQHCFLRFPSFDINALSSHPFTICSLPSTSTENTSEMIFYIRPRGGLTSRLYKHALTRPGVQTPVLVDGPYGGIDNQKYFNSDRLIVAAGGSGAGWMLPFVEQFLRHLSSTVSQHHAAKEADENTDTPDEPPRWQNSRGPRSLRVILATRDIATRAWFHTALDNLLSIHKSLGITTDLSIKVHLTGEVERMLHPSTEPAFDIATSNSSLQEEVSIMKNEPTIKDAIHHNAQEHETPGRPDLPVAIREEASASASSGQTVGVFVCGPLEMQNDVRNAVARENWAILKNPRSGGMYLHLEHFSWA